MAIPLLAAAGIAGASGLGSMMSGMSGANQVNQNIANASGQIQGIRNDLTGQGAQLTGMLQDTYSPLTQNFTGDMSAYRDLASQPSQTFQYQQFDSFAYDLQGQTQQFLDPSMDFQIQQATDAVQGSAANRGGLFRSATGKAIADRSQEIAQQSWKDAMEMALRDRGFQADMFLSDRERADRGTEFEAKQYGLNRNLQADILGKLTGMSAQGTMNLGNKLVDVQGDVFKGQNDLALALANLQTQKQDTGFMSGLGNFLSGAGNAFGGIAGGLK